MNRAANIAVRSARRIWCGLAFSFLHASAQPMSCVRVEAQAAAIRAEGLAEALPDIVVRCTGGEPARNGAPIPEFEFIVSSETGFSNRILERIGNQNWGWNDALLIVDEPEEPAQVACSPDRGAFNCPVWADSRQKPNVFQGKQLQGNAVVFQNVAIDPPGAGKTRTIRIANLRVNAAAHVAPTGDLPVWLRVSIFNFRLGEVPVARARFVSATVQKAMEFGVSTSDDRPPSGAEPVIILTPAMLPLNAVHAGVGFNLKFSEKFASAFRRRNAGTSGQDQGTLVNQAEPGVNYGTETGFFNGRLPDRYGMNLAGLADHGTRLIAVFSGIPDGIQVYVSAREVPAGTTRYSAATPKALLAYTDRSGANPFSNTSAIMAGFTPISVSNGAAFAVWEVTSSDLSLIEDISFSVALAATHGAPRLGTISVAGWLGPTSESVLGAADYAPTDGAKALPRFRRHPVVPFPAAHITPVLQVPRMVAVSAASYAASVAPDSIVAGFAQGVSLSPSVAQRDTEIALSGTTVEVTDFTGIRRQSRLFVVAPNQVNFWLDRETALGVATANVTTNGRLVASGMLRVEAVAPGLFTANATGAGVPAGIAVRLRGTQSTTQPLAVQDLGLGRWVANPIDLGGEGDLTYLSLFGTGFRGRSISSLLKSTAGGVPVPVLYAGPQGDFRGLDQINLGPLPAALAGQGEVELVVEVDEKATNRVIIQIQ